MVVGERPEVGSGGGEQQEYGGEEGRKERRKEEGRRVNSCMYIHLPTFLPPSQTRPSVSSLCHMSVWPRSLARVVTHPSTQIQVNHPSDSQRATERHHRRDGGVEELRCISLSELLKISAAVDPSSSS
jgi:hypothetical protein